MKTTIPSARPEMSLHQRILTDIQGLILSGTWEPGHRIPVEFALMKQYSCSRMTVSKALTELARARMIERRPKLGSFVCKPHSQSAVLTITDIKAEVATLGRAYSFEILRRSRRAGTREDRKLLAVEGAVAVLELICLHRAGDQPFCYEERLINLNAVPNALAGDFRVTPPGTWLLNTVPWALAVHRIRATVATPEVGKALKLRRKGPVLVIERTTRSAESTSITFVKLTYPAKLHELVATFSPPGPPRVIEGICVTNSGGSAKRGRATASADA